ncbi:MAG: histone deacetylase family protein [Burkholderiaceae bacterium]|jgi:acetoin utilization deacetylase AcuC-like enzyme|nr:histone deacetylase family protein [Burkholderiaceae bacterium]
MSKTGYFMHPDCRKHDMGRGHPESPERMDVIEDRLLASGVMDLLERRLATPANTGALLLAHGRRHVAALRGLNDMLIEEMAAGGPDHYSLDSDTVMNQYTYHAARLSAGAAIDAVEAVMHGELENAFCGTRPPGHHATRNQVMGFCFFSNVAIAAKYACERLGLQRVAIVDFDVHHGNGTEEIVAGDQRILMVSYYQHPFFPETPPRHETNLVNCPVPAYTRGVQIRELVEQMWMPRLEAHRPELIFISAGFDAHRDDDMGQMGMTEQDFAWITQRIKDVARQHAQGRIVSCLEGGYTLEPLARCVEAHVRVLAGV